MPISRPSVGSLERNVKSPKSPTVSATGSDRNEDSIPPSKSFLVIIVDGVVLLLCIHIL